MKKVILFLADGFEECEALITVDILRRAGIEVVMASVTGRKEVVSSRRITVLADVLADEADYTSADAVILPGGVVGTKGLSESPIVREQCRTFAENRMVAAICAAPSVLAELGLLEGRSATCHPSVEERMHGAVLTHESVAVSGNIITGQGLGAAFAFAFTLAGILAGEAKVHEIQAAICYRG